jgi:hypothetical protein
MANANTSRAQPAEGSQTTPNDTNSSMDPSSCNKLASEVAFLQDVLSSPPPTEAESGSNIAALLKQLDTADGVAQGVESRLDKLLSNLEGLLEGLEASLINSWPVTFD